MRSNAIKRCIFYIENLRSTLCKIAVEVFIRIFLPFSEAAYEKIFTCMQAKFIGTNLYAELKLSRYRREELLAHSFLKLIQT